MRVVLVGPVYPYRGGIAHHTTMLANSLRENHELKVVSFRHQYPAWLYPGETDRDPSGTPLRVDAAYRLSPFDPRTWRATEQEISEFRPGIVAVQWWTTFWGPCLGTLARALRTRGLSVVFLVHNVVPHEPKPGDYALARYGLRGGASFLIHSSSQRALLERLVPGARIVFCPHPTFPPLGPVRSKVEARRELNLDPKAHVLLFFGFVRPYKGLRLALQAVSHLRRAGVNAFLLVAGEFWEDKSDYERLASELEIRDRLYIDNRYIPNEDVGKYFAAADVLVAPYTGGTQSGVLRLAAGYGLPAVISSSLVSGESGGGAQGGGLGPCPAAIAFLDRVIEAFAACGAPVTAVQPASTSWGQLAEAVVACSTGLVEEVSPYEGEPPRPLNHRAT